MLLGAKATIIIVCIRWMKHLCTCLFLLLQLRHPVFLLSLPLSLYSSQKSNQRTTVYSNILNILCKEQFKRLLRFLSEGKAHICVKTILLFKDLTTTAFSKDFGLKIKFIVNSSLFFKSFSFIIFSVFFFHNKQTLFSEFEILFSHHTEFKVNNLSQ